MEETQIVKKKTKALTIDEAVNQPGVPATNKQGNPVTFSPEPTTHTCHTSSTQQHPINSEKWIC